MISSFQMVVLDQSLTMPLRLCFPACIQKHAVSIFIYYILYLVLSVQIYLNYIPLSFQLVQFFTPRTFCLGFYPSTFEILNFPTKIVLQDIKKCHIKKNKKTDQPDLSVSKKFVICNKASHIQGIPGCDAYAKSHCSLSLTLKDKCNTDFLMMSIQKW